MKAFLLHRDRDFDLKRALPANEPALMQDLELDTLLETMAAGDSLLFEVAKRALLLGLDDPDAIVYRQHALADCLENAPVARHVYTLAGDALEAERRVWSGFSRDSPRTMLRSAVQKLELLVGFLKKLRATRDQHARGFRSEAFTRFFAMLAEELDEQYFELIEGYLKELKFKGGMLLSAQLTAGNKGTGYVLRRAREQSRLGRVLDRSGYWFTIPDRDESGFRALGELEDNGLNSTANALTHAVDHVRSFFVMLRVELGFYVACLNLSERLTAKGEPTCTPVALPCGENALSARGLYEPCLTLTIEPRVVGNDIDADRKSLVMITGANQGGKSTFLRSIGLAQLMTQCGMFVAAESFRVNVCDAIFTHFKREEDETMESGKLDEELSRMSEIADHITPNSLLLCNESFAATNEREGSEIARQVIHALLDERVKLLVVTHMFDLADGFHRERLDTSLFLRAERGADGARPFKLSEGQPLPTSYGEDSYRRIFGQGIGATAAALPDRRRS